MKYFNNKPRLLALLTAMLWSVFCVIAMLFSWLYELETFLGDIYYQTGRSTARQIHVIGIDQYSLDTIGAWNTWTRGTAADLINILNADPDSKPAVIGLDIMYFNDTEPQYDAALAEACQRGGNVIAASQAIFKKTVRQAENGNYYFDQTNVDYIKKPYQALLENSQVAHINTLIEKDGIVRYSNHTLKAGDEISKSFADAISQRYAQKKGLTLNPPPLDDNGRWYMSFAGKPGDYFGGNSFAKVLSGEISAKRFADSIVLIGPYASGMQDSYLTPADKNIPMYGVEIHANAVQQLLEGEFLKEMPFTWQLSLLFISLMFCGCCFINMDIKKSALVYGAVLIIFSAFAYVSFRLGYMVSLPYTPIGASVLFIFGVSFNYYVEQMRRNQITLAFKKYVAPQVVDDIIKSGSAELSLVGQKRDIAVMFLDIRGFTTISEQLSPEDVVGFLNDYLSLVTSICFENGGTIDKFIGDAAMVLFNAPFDQADFEMQAVKAGLQIITKAHELSKKTYERIGKEVMLGIGINVGDAVVGNIGTQYRMDFTAIGDTVNTAARLEGKAKAGEIIISKALHDRLEGRIVSEKIGELELKGKSEKIICYSVFDIIV